MLSMIRRIFTLAAVMSLVLCAVMRVMWKRSRSTSEGWHSAAWPIGTMDLDDGTSSDLVDGGGSHALMGGYTLG